MTTEVKLRAGVAIDSSPPNANENEGNTSQLDTVVKETGMTPESRATKKTRARYDRIAPIYDLVESVTERFLFRKLRRGLWEQVSGDLVLEVGVGTGKNIPYYPEYSRVVAIDFSQKMLKRARKRAKREGSEVELHHMDVQALSFEDNSFDTAAGSFVFCSVPDPILGLRELARVTSPKGKIMLLEHMRPEWTWLGWIFDLINPLVVRLFGFNINRRTLDNVREADLKIEAAIDLSAAGIVKLLILRPRQECLGAGGGE